MNSLMSQSRRVMDKTEFLAAIKLVSGEEILSMVTSVHDENGDYLIVENPIEVEEVILLLPLLGSLQLNSRHFHHAQMSP